MENSNNPEAIKKQYEELKVRNRLTGVGGITVSDGVKAYGEIPVEASKVFEERKNMMTYKDGVAFLGIKKQNLPNVRKRDSNLPPSGIKVFSLGDAKPKVSKENKK